jgi:acid phosphatase
MLPAMRTLMLSLAVLAACGDDHHDNPMVDAPMGSGSGMVDAPPAANLDSIHTLVVIYAENRGFDNMYGSFPGANGVPANPPVQKDRDGSTLPKLPQAWGGVTAAGFTPAITQAMSDNLANAPYGLEATYAGLDKTYITRDLYHRFFENQMQIHGGANDMFAAWADSGGLVMGHYDGSSMALWALAQQFVLADNFFMGAFGGSFLNHQYLICGCAPEYPNADTAAAHPTVAVLSENDPPMLALGSASPASSIDGPPSYMLSGNIAPSNYFGDNTFRAINTMQPPYQPSGNAPASSDSSKLFADPTKPTTLPAQTQMTVGDQLDAKGVSWKWYSGAWASTLATATGDRMFPPNTTPGSVPNFQFHHQPFNYYATFDPSTHASARTQHLKDYTDLVADAQAGTLPDVVFYKPEGDLNQHPGYASVSVGDQHIADLVHTLQQSPQYANMLIVITYDENGGFWDHVAPPKGDKLGPSTRIPAIIISPFAKRGYVDHTQYDTGSILRFIARRWGLSTLPGIAARDAALAAHGEMPMGDLTSALDF